MTGQPGVLSFSLPTGVQIKFLINAPVDTVDRGVTNRSQEASYLLDGRPDQGRYLMKTWNVPTSICKKFYLRGDITL